jgi:putative DNA primase/helicase
MATDVMAAAAGQWPRLLIELAGLAPEQLENRHQPCPACGGTDRYRWDRDDGPGGWFCNQCGGRDQRGGGGSGMDLLLRLTGWDFATAARRIEAHLALPAGQAAAFPAPVPQKPASPARKAGRPARIPGTPPPDAPPPELGRASGQWCYTDAAGAPLFWVQRLDLLQGGRQRKVFVQRTWLDGGWHFPSRRDPFRSDWPPPRPLYRLAELERHFWAPVLITEGEKAADAAAALFPDHVVVSWCGGSQAIASVDWSPLAGRAVNLWPDADASGREAMARLSALLLELGCPVAVVLPPSCTEEDWDLADAPGASGWDLADATWSPAEAQAYLEGHSRTVQLPEPEAAADADGADSDATDLPTADGTNADRPPPGPHGAAERPGGSEPFVCLGYDSDGYFYQPRSTGQVVRLGSSAHGGVNLCRLAPLAYWETLYPNKRGVNWTAAASDLFCRQAAIGMFDPDLLRGRGIWWDEGRCVLHLGDRLVVDGEPRPLSATLNSRFHYQRGAALVGTADAQPLSDEEALLVLTLADRFHWEVPASAMLLAGWVTLAPICGALRWRPHLWLSGPAGSGKSHLFERFCGVLLADMARVFVGSVTEAGIRQTLRSDALPVLIDEAESNEREDQQRIQAILALARVASSESRAAIVKGSPAGEVARYSVRSMFLLSSIATGLKQGADRRRFAPLNLRNPSELPQQQREAHWQALDRDLEQLITPNFANRLIARTVALIPVIRRSITVCSRVAAAHFDSQALGDQYGTLLAGAWSLQASRVPSAAEVQSLIDGADWSSYRESTEIPDERRCLNRILQHQLRVESEERSVVTRTVLELVELVSTAMPSPIEPVRPADAADLLARHGLRVREGELLISNSAEAIGRMLADTAWVTNWGAILSRLPGASRSLLVHFRGLGSSRAVALPLVMLTGPGALEGAVF